LGKLRVLSGGETCAILQRHGFVAVRQRGSHIVMQKMMAQSGTITVPVPNHGELKIGTLRSIIRQSGIARSEFES
jgi:predicted RNA binding protein YcfA (HicA-like mRNA interferase family)